MGASSSTLSEPGSEHSALPTSPYYGNATPEHKVLEVTANVKGTYTGRWSTNVFEQMGQLEYQYSEGFTLDTIFRVPQHDSSGPGGSMNVRYLAIVSKATETEGSWKPKLVDSSLIVDDTLTPGTVMTTKSHGDVLADVFNIINQQAESGGRLARILCTGDLKDAGSHGEKFGVKLLFNMPLHPDPTPRFITLATCTTMKVSINMATAKCSWDPESALTPHLDQGWRLVDVIAPQYECKLSTRQRRFTPHKVTVIFLFEREEKRNDDTTPLFEVSVCTVKTRSKKHLVYHTSKMNLTPLVSNMEKMGWRVVSILDIPEISSSMLSNTVKGAVVAFFQRPLSAL